MVSAGAGRRGTLAGASSVKGSLEKARLGEEESLLKIVSPLCPLCLISHRPRFRDFSFIPSKKKKKRGECWTRDWTANEVSSTPLQKTQRIEIGRSARESVVVCNHC